MGCQPQVHEPHDPVIEEIRRQQAKRGRWLGTILLLVVSLAVFFGAGAAKWDWDWKFPLLIVPILLFHEAGHWLPMKAFGDCNPKMFLFR